MLKSSRLPIGVATMYKPGFILFLLILFIFLISCSPVNYSSLENVEPVLENMESVEVINNKKIVVVENKKIEEKNKKTKPQLNISPPLLNEISIILPINKKYEITEQFVNVIELAVYQKKLQNTSFTIDLYKDSNDLHKIIQEKISPGKIFIGPLDSKETTFLNQYCKKGVIFFSFSSSSLISLDLPNDFLSRKPIVNTKTIAQTKAIVPTTIAPIVDFVIPQKVIPPENQAREALEKAAPESVPNAVPVEADPTIEAIENIPADAPAAPTFPAKALVALRVNPLSSLKTASLTFSHDFAAL